MTSHSGSLSPSGSLRPDAVQRLDDQAGPSPTNYLLVSLQLGTLSGGKKAVIGCSAEALVSPA